MKYNILKYSNERADLREAARNISEFIEKNNITTIVALDKSGRPASLLVNYTYQNLYPNKKPPKIYFLNPEPSHPNRSLKQKNSLLHKHIISNPEEKVLLLEDYVNSGQTILSAKKILCEDGAQNVYLGSLFGTSRKNHKSIDVMGKEDVLYPSWWRRPQAKIKRYTGVKEKEGQSFADPTKEAIALRKELRYLAGDKWLEQETSIVDKIKSKLEKLVSSVFILLGLILITSQSFSLKIVGAVISTSQKGNVAFVLPLLFILIGAILLFKPFKN